MKKKIFLLTILALACAPWIWAGGSDDKHWMPSEQYSKWCRQFNINKSWKFASDGAYNNDKSNPDDGVSTIDCPGIIAWNLMTWNNKTTSTDDYNFDWAVIYLYDEATQKRHDLVRIDFDGTEYEGDDAGDRTNYLYEGNPKKFTDKNGNKTYWVQKRMNQDYQDGSQFCYFETELSVAAIQFIETAERLRLGINCRWDGTHFKEHDIREGVPAKTPSVRPIAPTIASIEWSATESQTRLNYNITPNSTDLETRVWVRNTKDGDLATLINWEKLTNGLQAKSWALPAKYTVPDILQTPQGMPTFYAQSRKGYAINKDHWRSGHGMTVDTKYSDSEITQMDAPLFMQPYDLTTTTNSDGTVTVSWKIKKGATNADHSNFILERSDNANFAENVIPATGNDVRFDPDKLTYSYKDPYDYRNRGTIKVYYRLYRENADREHLAIKKDLEINTEYVKIVRFDAANEGSTTKLTWELSATGIWNDKMNLQLTQNTTGSTAGQPKIFDRSVTSYETQLATCTPTDFRLAVAENGQERHARTISEITIQDTTAAAISRLSLSKGFYTDKVILSWFIPRDSAAFSEFRLYRREAESDSWQQLPSQDFHLGVYEYSYQDQTVSPGQYYYYRVEGWSTCASTSRKRTQIEGLGFAQPYGVVTGQVLYSGNQGVKGARITAEGSTTRRNCALSFGEPMQTTIANPTHDWEHLKTFYDPIPSDASTYAIEMWVKADFKPYCEFVYAPYAFDIYVNSNKQLYGRLYQRNGDSQAAFSIPYDDLKNSGAWKDNEYNHFVLHSSLEASRTRLFLNGHLVYEWDRATQSPSTLHVGYVPNNLSFVLMGDVREFNVYKSRMSDETDVMPNTIAGTAPKNAVGLVHHDKMAPKYNGTQTNGYLCANAMLPAEQAKNVFGPKDGSAEMWVNTSIGTVRRQLLYSPEGILWYIDTDKKLKLNLVTRDQTYLGNNTIEADLNEQNGWKDGQYNHLAFTYHVDQSNKLHHSLYINGRMVARNDSHYLSPERSFGCSDALYLGAATDGAVSQLPDAYFVGYMDEIRFWNTCRDSLTIRDAYNGYMSGIEQGLSAYYRCDDEVTGEIYDISKTNYRFNERHMKTSGTQVKTDNLPTPDQLSLSTLTDSLGNYMLNAIPYSENGTTYTIYPSLGTHAFSPAQRPLHFNRAASTHNSINFTDESSFPVSGHVFYQGTTYPVEGCTFTVDGQTCTANNQVVRTDANGAYTIQVPIGKHRIEIVKDGHVFQENGTWPRDPENAGLKYDFQKELRDIDFVDNTLVTLTGRVAGGPVQAVLPHGFQVGKNNIGVAGVNLSPVVKGVYLLNTDTTAARQWSAPEGCAVRSHATTRRHDGTNHAMYIHVETDSVTGEFSCLVPPIDLTLDSVIVPSNRAIQFNTAAVAKVELSKMNSRNAMTDSVFDAKQKAMRYFSYNGKMDLIWHEKPVLTVRDKNRKDSLFGMTDFSIVDKDHDTVYVVPLIEKDEKTGVSRYTRGVPFFRQNDSYHMHLKASECYYNYDNPNAVTVDSIPVSKSVVTVSNNLSTQPGVAFRLDSVGEANYMFIAGEPNITATEGDSTHRYQKSISIQFTNTEGTERYDWDMNKLAWGVVLGEHASGGTNFITEGPTQILFVLRDPPGSKSKATWVKGSSRKVESRAVSNYSSNGGIGTEISFGMDTKMGTGVGVMVINSMQAVDELDITETGGKKEKSTISSTSTFSLTESVSTKADASHVGASGDVFVGLSTNINITETDRLSFYRDTLGNFNLEVHPCINQGLSYNTTFYYSQREIEVTQIPSLREARNTLLKTMSQAEIDRIVADTTLWDPHEYRYLTTLSRSDARFGEEGTYTSVPASDATAVNRVQYFNAEIQNWKDALAKNEETKVKAIYEGKAKKQYNISVGDGAGYSATRETVQVADTFTSTIHDWENVIKNKFGFRFNRVGTVISQVCTTVKEWGDETDESTTHKESVSFDIDLNLNEHLAINVYEGTDAFGPIFFTVAGQTACPYEGVQRTKYYKPGQYELNTATVAIDQPQIEVTPAMVNNVPISGRAIYQLTLRNNSESTAGTDMRLRALASSNPNGASLMVGSIDLGGTHMVQRMQPQSAITQTLVLTQTDPTKLDYDSIAIVWASDCDPYTKADTAYISAHFVAMCNEPVLTLDRTVVNSNDSTATITMTVRGYDLSLSTFRRLRLEYRLPSEVNWQQIVSVEKDSLQPSFIYAWSMRPMLDGEYQVRAVTECEFGGVPVPAEGEAITIIKDMAPPVALNTPSPINGILTSDNEIYVDFNERIRPQMIDANNIRVRGSLNGAHISKQIALMMSHAQSGIPVASTEAAYLLDGNFTINCWFKLTEEPKSADLGILAHGDYLRLLIRDGKLVVRVSDHSGERNDEFVAERALPMNQWCYISLQMSCLRPTDATATLTLHVASDALSADEELFLSTTTQRYTANQPMLIGNAKVDPVTSCIRDLQLWTNTPTWADRKSLMNNDKSSYRTYLYGYWPLNEGMGRVAEDKMRSRNMVLSNPLWTNSESVNYILRPLGPVDMPISEKQSNGDEDVTLQFWFYYEAPCMLFQVLGGNDSLGIGFSSDQFIMRSGTKEIHRPVAAPQPYQWHHLALNIRQRADNEILLDGAPIVAFETGYISRLQGDTIRFNPDGGIRALDEISLWHSTLSPEWIKTHRHDCVDPSMTGLMAYYPMNKDADLEDAALNKNTTHRPLRVYHNDHAMAAEELLMRSDRQLTSIKHTYTASDTRIVIQLTEAPASIEGQTMDMEVVSVVDEHGNYSKPIRWSAYVHRNLLKWDVPNVTITKQVLDQKQFVISFTNGGGSIESWAISGLPSWMHVNEESGSLTQLTTKIVTFTIDESLAIGHYEPVIYLTGNQGIYEPLTFTVQVTGDRPDWEINPAEYAYSMNIIGQLDPSFNVPVDTSDMVAAKIGNKIAGLAHPQQLRIGSTPYIMLDVYANLTEQQLLDIAAGKPGPKVEFEYWDASTGLTYTNLRVWCNLPSGEYQDTTICFKDGAVMGSITNPMMLHITNMVRQEIKLSKGWNWYSFNVLPASDTANVFLRPLLPYIGEIKAQDSYAELDSVRQQLIGSLDRIDICKKYRAQVFKEGVTTLTGFIVNPLAIPFRIYRGWNWIGYTPNMTLSVEKALSAMQAREGDIIKSQRGFATYTNHQWIGSLRAMTPGVGYMYYSNTQDSTTFHYPSPASVLLIQERVAEDEADYHYTPVSRNLYSGNMTLTAVVMDGDLLLPTAGLEVAVFAGEECRTTMHATDDRFFLTVPGDESVMLEFRVWDGVKETRVRKTIPFVNDAHHGSYNQPYVIQIGATEDIFNTEDADKDGVRKFIIDDAVYILRAGRWYDVLGHETNQPIN